jgi:tetratricopeptide (TPR) repeat protein
MIKILRIYILYRLYISLALIVLGILSHIYGDPILAWILYILAFFSLLLHFLIGPMRLVKDAVESGNVDEAVDLINKVRYPKLLIKPIRSAYYMLQSTLNVASNDLGKAEQNIRKSLATQSSLTGDMRGTNLMQLGFIQLKQGKSKEAIANLKEAVRAGIPDKESEASVYLQLCSYEIQRQQYKMGKTYFKKAKDLRPKNPEIVEQIKILEKTISRLPG